jgi:hypothetical protein
LIFHGVHLSEVGPGGKGGEVRSVHIQPKDGVLA